MRSLPRSNASESSGKFFRGRPSWPPSELVSVLFFGRINELLRKSAGGKRPGARTTPWGFARVSLWGFAGVSLGLRRGQPLFLVFGLPVRGLPGVRDTIPNFAGSRIQLRRRMHAQKIF
jgi:hypothetical protein